MTVDSLNENKNKYMSECEQILEDNKSLMIEIEELEDELATYKLADEMKEEKPIEVNNYGI